QRWPGTCTLISSRRLTLLTYSQKREGDCISPPHIKTRKTRPKLSFGNVLLVLNQFHIVNEERGHRGVVTIQVEYNTARCLVGRRECERQSGPGCGNLLITCVHRIRIRRDPHASPCDRSLCPEVYGVGRSYLPGRWIVSQLDPPLAIGKISVTNYLKCSCPAINFARSSRRNHIGTAVPLSPTRKFIVGTL